MSIKIRNTLAVILIGMMHIFILIGPESSEDYAVLRCDSSGEIIAKFSNINECVEESRKIKEWEY